MHRLSVERPPAAEQLLMATEASEIGWWEVEGGDGRMSWSPRVQALFEPIPDTPETIEDFFRRVHPDDRDRVRTALAAAADPSRSAFYEEEFRLQGGGDDAPRWVAARGRAVFDADGRCSRVIGTAVDITARIQAQEAQRVRNKEYAALREHFIVVLAHDLRNPLASIAAASRLLLRRPQSAQEMADHIDRSVARMTELIDNIFDFARARQGGSFVSVSDSEEPLDPTILQVVDELRLVHPDQEVAVDLDLRDVVRCDRVRIGQLLSNLLGNAFSHGTPGAPISVRAHTASGELELSVLNSGATIEPNDIEHLFLPFFRGKDRGNRKGLGLGLGLYVCSEIAKAHGGTIAVSSADEKTIFTLRMPINAERPDDPGTSSRAS